MTALASTLDIEQPPCAGNDNRPPAPSTPEPDIIPLDLVSAPSKPSRDVWHDDVMVLDDWRERELVQRLYELSDNIGRCLDLAAAADAPKLMKENLKYAVGGLKSALTTIWALDRHRHGDAQKIKVEYGTAAATSARKSDRHPRFAKSDAYVDWRFGFQIGHLTDFETSCRQRADALSRCRREELVRGFRNGRFEPDMRTWESQFLGLSSWLSGQIVKLQFELDRRYSRGQQHIVVERTKGRSRVRKIPLIAGDPADLPKGGEPAFAVAKDVKTAVKDLIDVADH